MHMSTSKEIFLKDYKEPDFWIEKTELFFDIEVEKTIVHSKLSIKRNGTHSGELVLDGVDLKLLELSIDGQELSADDYSVTDKSLIVITDKNEFVLESKVEIDPKNNFSCEGLYKSGEIFCTQNEAQGFRKITYFLDRPDVMSKFTTTLKADQKVFPTLLSNGNKLSESVDDNGKLVVSWEDPHPKPAYLFAVVAGDLAKVQDTYTTMSGREVKLEIFVDHGNEDKCDHAMLSLKNSMKWDEDKYGLEYDLDIYMVVAVDSFNMGAMENKGLNIFNSAYVLAKKETATDANFAGIEAVIGHEYFHNWTGNRVTCRDWFQLTLKEGLTVFRDQEFSSDMLSRPVKRIDDVVMLRRHQFPEDQGPMSHPIQPKSYIEINNFYTATVYEKGAEVIRMIHTLLGEKNFRKGMDLYFERHDGQAVTTDDFVNAMSDASGIDLAQFKMWYHQNGTPKLKISEKFNEGDKTFELCVEQVVDLKGQDFASLHMPFHIGLIDHEGQELPIDGELELKNTKEIFKFENIDKAPIVSLNRGFSAPVIIEKDYSDKDLIHLMAFDTDTFSRYEAAQELYKKELKRFVEAYQSSTEYKAREEFFTAYGRLLNDESLEKAYLAYALALPTVKELYESYEVYTIEAAHYAIKNFKLQISDRFKDDFERIYHSLETKDFDLSAKSMGERSLRQVCMSFLTLQSEKKYSELAIGQFENATNMTEEFSALSFLVNNYHSESDAYSQAFYKKWKHETLVIQKWFALQTGYSEVSIETLNELENNEAYDKKVPNLLRSLVGGFAMNNHLRFNDPSGDGYKYVADKIIEIDSYNPQVASRLAKSMNHLKRLDEKRKGLLAKELERILTHKLSDDTFEVVNKNLNG
ncbi:MAG: aminopeptidase N [Bacteriovoracaceae bacterium]|nr:aminopeptidase N [Bacteriovoracaceae bacterium]